MSITVQELRVAASFLRQAKTLLESVRDLFLGQDAGAAARLGEIVRRAEDECAFVEGLIAKPNGNGGKA